jgi:hypothetical protein
VWEALVVALCSYEVVVLVGRRLVPALRRWPTISRFLGRHQWLIPLFLAGLAWHLYSSR